MTAATTLESALGNPYEPGNPAGAARVLEADEAGVLPAEAEAVLDAYGYPAHYVPASEGGRLTSVPDLVRTIRPVFARDAALGLGHGLTTFMAGLNVMAAGHAGQRREVADRILGGERISVAYHEFAHGNDFTGNDCTARAASGGYVLSGRKELINNAHRAGSAVAFVRTDESIGPRSHSLFHVPLDLPGVSRLGRYPTLSVRGCTLAGLGFDGVAVGAEHLIGEEGGGAEVALRSFQVSRCVAAGAGLGPVEESLFLVLTFARGRALYGRTVLDLPHARAVLAEAYADLLTAEAMVLDTAAALHVDPRSAGPRCAAVKYLVPRMLEEVMNSLAVVLGARFYLRSGPWAAFGKHYRDLPALAIGHAGGASCQLAILPHLRRLTAVRGDGATEPFVDRATSTWSPIAASRAGSAGQPPFDLPPLDLSALALRPAGTDPALSRLYRSLMGGTTSGSAAGAVSGPADAAVGAAVDRIARALRTLEEDSARLPVAHTGVTAPVAAFALTERYALLLAASAVRAVADGETGWTRLATARLADRLEGRRPKRATHGVDELVEDLCRRADAGLGFDLAGRPVSRRLDP